MTAAGNGFSVATQRTPVRHAPVLVAACLVLAGCSGLLAPDSGAATDTVTPVPVSAAEDGRTDERITVEGPLPAWLAPDGRIDSDRLADAHRRALANRSFGFETTHVARNDSGVVWRLREQAAIRNATRWRLQRTARPFDEFVYVDRPVEYPFTSIIFADETGQYTRERNVTSGAWTTDVVFRWFTAQPRNWSVARTVHALSDRADRVERVRRDGQPYYRVVARTEWEPDSWDGFGVDGQVTDYGVTAYVTPEGFVDAVAISFVEREGPETRRHTVRVRHRGVGNTTVETPAWVNQLKYNRSATQ